MNAEELIDKLLNFYKVSNVAELSTKIDTSQKTISNWKIRNSINAIKKKCRELGIYKEIFEDSKKQENINDSLIKTEINENNLSKYFTALQSVAIATNKEDELIEDIKNLMKKYLG